MVLTLARAVEKYSSEAEKKAATAVVAAKATGLPSHLSKCSVLYKVSVLQHEQIYVR